MRSGNALLRSFGIGSFGMGSIGLASIGLGLAVSLWVPVAAAQSTDAARAHYERGIALYDEGQFSGALAEFEAAYEGSHRASILFNIGQIHARLGRAVEAVEALQRYLAESGAALSPDRRALVESEIATQSARIATVTVAVSVPGAVVSFDDVDVGSAPLASPLRTAAGEHVIVARADGFEPARFRFRIAGGEARTLTLELVPHAEGSARLRLVIGVPGAEVRVDGRSVGLSPIELPLGLPEGQHRIELSRPGYEPLERTVILPPSGEETLQFDLVRVVQAAPGVMTRVALSLPTTSHTIRVDGLSIAPGTASIEVPYGLHDLLVEAEDMVPVRRRIDVPQGPTFVFDEHYQWEPTRREQLRAAAADQRLAGIVTTVLGGLVGLGGGALLIGREVQYGSAQIRARQDLVEYCNTPDMMTGRPPEDCETRIAAMFPREGDSTAFIEQTNRELSLRESLAVSGYVLVGVGAGALITGIIVLVLPPSDEQIDEGTTTAPRVSLDVGPSGVSVHGTF